MAKTILKEEIWWGTLIPNWKGGGVSHVFMYKGDAEVQAKKNKLHKKVIPVIVRYQKPLIK